MEMFLYYLAAMVVSYALAQALQPKPKNRPPATMDDFEFPQAEEGTPQPVFFGDVWTSGWTVLSYGNLRTKAIEA